MQSICFCCLVFINAIIPNIIMGGTKIGSALEIAVRLRCSEKLQQDILLITDGEIWEWEK